MEKNNTTETTENKKRRQKNFQLTLTDAEWERYEIVYTRAQIRLKHNVKLTQADVNRRLVGLESPDELVTTEDINYFLYNIEPQTMIVTEMPTVSADVSETDVRPKTHKIPVKKAVNGD